MTLPPYISSIRSYSFTFVSRLDDSACDTDCSFIQPKRDFFSQLPNVQPLSATNQTNETRSCIRVDTVNAATSGDAMLMRLIAKLARDSAIIALVFCQATAAVSADNDHGTDIAAFGASPGAAPAVNRNALEQTISAHGKASVPAGRFRTDLSSSEMPGPISGPGQVGDSNGNWRAPTFDSVKRLPGARGRYDSVETAFNGDWRHADGEEYRITGSDTLGRPVAGYLFTPEASPHYLALYNNSGWNQDTAGNHGRTAAVGYRIQGHQYGQGDLIDFSASCFVKGRRAGATNFLANPACALFAGDTFAGENGVYLNPLEINLEDQGFAAAGIGAVFNLHRSNSAQDLGVWWAGVRLQQTGAAAVDVAWSASGKFQVGLDFTNVSFSNDEAAITLAAGQRIYGGATSRDQQRRRPTSLGVDWITRDPMGGWDIVVDGTKGVKISAATMSTEGSVQAHSFNSSVGVKSAVLGSATVVGTEATVTCAPGHKCDQFSGAYVLSTDSGGEVRGLALTLTFAEDRVEVPNCVANLQLEANFVLPLPVGSKGSTHGVSFVTGAPLAPHSRYTLSYVCGGS